MSSDDSDSDSTRGASLEIRAAAKLAVEATKQVAGVVEDMQIAIAGGPSVLGRPFAPLVALFSAPVYASIRAVADVVGVGLDRVLEELAPAFDASTPGAEYDAVRAALNGVFGDRLAEAGNALAIPMSLRSERRTLELERGKIAAPHGRLLVLVHGSSMDDAGWTRDGHDHGEALARDLGLVPLTVRYNSGRHVSTNGRELAGMLERLTAAWPHPLEELVLFGFSMGGLVARSAIHVAEAEGLAWRRRLSAVVFLGTPHHGAPLERAGNVLGALLDVTAYSAPLGRLAQLRSAGVTDLRHGNVRDEDWSGRDRFAHGDDARLPCPLPAGVPCFAVAATTGVEVSGAPRDLAGLTGDGLVPVASALGRHPDAARDLALPLDHQHVVPGCTHLGLLASADAYAKIHAWLRSR